ncbi:NarL family two-component system sensor histidine kinase YdfH [Clostridium acetobutylicum]|uniref:histidine kinase n=1 Tax=Clostridium acetobutylicum (strain ATCC 824 / DSM 792 / JCM 1419 / IAM 19013 / LMG 5710 / NBRC 13948 / NRRL B-527 / VKM B-1787 / 2291 / W) TaxID=272562 RepID=Q97DP2_CLOAB|nr:MULTISPECIES: sensor histidine kinase [Clostridium]AAK81360.1 Membrane associated, signal transduction histidine kinase-like ATPase [Clostridium acetobutylicum ATCC 824]ADZ22471.1 Membrane associated, signal transduction histidine kinase-like ATPase [Clostridium acetobutylicum EA 2018]AEI32840.1 membrane associated, signal transduction histidine kinase-like ATPase [Clostridium acetobutylicum DSM 1731]AWV80972.1 sensor histidine kinase [Clostridium acetobutylicum]MBC2393704.1 sensor histidin
MASKSYDEEKLNFRLLSIICIILVCVFSLFLQNIKEIYLFQSIIFTLIMILFFIMYWFSYIFKNRYWIYFLIQGIIICACAFLIQKGYHALFIGIIPILMSQSVELYYNIFKIILTFIFLYSIFCGTVVIINGAYYLPELIPVFLIIIIFVIGYSAIFFKQVKLRIQTQKVLKELELAYDKVEELTLTNERQRMARDLHDTLSQGIAGIIMQLEAVNANLNKNNNKRAQEIVLKAMEHARKTLADSRLVIEDLRSETDLNGDFIDLVKSEVSKFRNLSSSEVEVDIQMKSQITTKILEHLLYIIRECLNNIAKHAKAENVQLKIIEESSEIKVEVIDDGIGFEVESLNKVYGHYGILGITERVRSIKGEIEIKSKKRLGTNVSIIIPIEKGILKENE